jgi:7-cyano-7-deazaguanine synthase
MVIPLGFIGQYFKSDLLLSGGAIPEGGYAEENMKSTVVPFRNGIMLAVAAGLAESYGLDTVLLANHSGDHAIYPDCRPEFVEAMDAAVKAGTYEGIRVVSPYCDITKRDIALRGRAIGLDYSLTYSCYKGGEKHCGKCGTCTERKEALEGFDPTEYEA